MSLKAWQECFGTAHLLPLPLDLEHAVTSLESWRNIFKDSLGMIILALFLKIPAARDASTERRSRLRIGSNQQVHWLRLATTHACRD